VDRRVTVLLSSSITAVEPALSPVPADDDDDDDDEEENENGPSRGGDLELL
jgi:hypothetical protein